MTLKDQNPIQRVKASGIQGASPIDLISIGLSRTEADALEGEGMARRIFTRYGGIRQLGEAATADLSVMSGLDDFEVLRAQALMEIGRRTGLAARGKPISVDSPEDIMQVISFELNRYRHEKREHFFVVLLDTKNQIMKIETIHIGTLNMSLVGPREVFRVAVREAASSIILAHNHPSGDPTPSPEDIEVTRRLAEVGRMLDIPVLDHVIIGDPRSVSLHQKGHI